MSSKIKSSVEINNLIKERNKTYKVKKNVDALEYLFLPYCDEYSFVNSPVAKKFLSVSKNTRHKIKIKTKMLYKDLRKFKITAKTLDNFINSRLRLEELKTQRRKRFPIKSYLTKQRREKFNVEKDISKHAKRIQSADKPCRCR